MKITTRILIALTAFACTSVTASDTVYYYHNDHLGTPQVMTDKDQVTKWQADQTPFGLVYNLPISTIENNLRFPGQYYDAESGLHYNYFRDYDPSIGRYIQSDPIGLRGGINTYTYVGGSPIIRFDFFGLCACGLPISSEFFGNYPDYDNYTGSDVWGLIGGSLNESYGENSPGGSENSCAARVSYAFNESGANIPPGIPGGNRNWAGDNNRYIISAQQLNNYLRNTYGDPAQTLTNETQLNNMISGLESGQAAIVSSGGHAGVVTGSYTDPYVSGFLGDVWVLPVGACSC